MVGPLLRTSGPTGSTGGRARGPVHSSLIETATTIRPPTSEFRETMRHWTYHSDGAASSLTPSDRLQRWGQIGWRVNNVQIPIP